jgi:hypothetical protein
MDDPVFHPPLELNRIMVGGNDDLHRRWLHSSPTGCPNECGGIIEDGIKISYEWNTGIVEWRNDGIVGFKESK